MTPTETTFTIPNELTGCTGVSNVCEGATSQTINPSELNLWRVIRINPDGTVEMVSEYVSSTEVYFYGQIGYQNLVGTLNYIASAYGNSKYTVATRHMGYDGQTPFLIEALSLSTCGTSDTADNNKETSGCGDISYQRDTNLVSAALDTLNAYDVNSTSTAKVYWLSSRCFGYGGAPSYGWDGRVVHESGAIARSHLVYYRYNWDNGNMKASVRPIVVFRAGVVASSGSGTSASPWVLS